MELHHAFCLTAEYAGRLILFRMISSPSTKICKEESWSISSTRRSSMGSTIRPRLSIFRTMPVDFIIRSLLFVWNWVLGKKPVIKTDGKGMPARLLHYKLPWKKCQYMVNNWKYIFFGRNTVFGCKKRPAPPAAKANGRQRADEGRCITAAACPLFCKPC